MRAWQPAAWRGEVVTHGLTARRISASSSGHLLPPVFCSRTFYLSFLVLTQSPGPSPTPESGYYPHFFFFPNEEIKLELKSVVTITVRRRRSAASPVVVTETPSVALSPFCLESSELPLLRRNKKREEAGGVEGAGQNRRFNERCQCV